MFQKTLKRFSNSLKSTIHPYAKATSLRFSHELTVKDRQAFWPNLSDEQ